MNGGASNVQVAVRVRPLSARERLAGATENLISHPPSAQIIAGPEQSFTFDCVYSPEAGQGEVFEGVVGPLMGTFVDGFNCTILAYGQTGSGKTFTMGTGLDGNLEQLTQGIIPRAVHYISTKMEEKYGTNLATFSSSEPHQQSADDFYEIYVSFLEIYNEDIIDLLAPQTTCSSTIAARKKSTLVIREDAQGDIYLAGIREERVQSVEEIFALLQKGSLSRTTKSTDMNLVSSRSHAIFTVMLRQKKEGQTLVSKLHFVDLAGSERLKRTNAQGDRVKESISINSGLLALGNVISALGDESKRATHVPYRDSKLTRLLQDSLGGNSKTLMIACVSPSSDNFIESLNTLKYAHRAKNIKNTVSLNEEVGGNSVFEIAQLKKQISALKQEVLTLRTSRRGSVEDGGNSSMTPAKTPFGKSQQDTATELNRLRVQNAELKRKYDLLVKEKINVEAERDFYKSSLPTKVGGGSAGQNATGPNLTGIKEHLKRISELQGRVSDLEQQLKSRGEEPGIGNGPRRLQRGSFPSRNIPNPRLSVTGTGSIESPMPQTPVWLRQANALVGRAREEIRENISVIHSVVNDNNNVDDEDDGDIVMNSTEPTNPMQVDNESMTLGINNKAGMSSSSSSIHNVSQAGTTFVSQAQFAAAVATHSEQLLSKIRSDISIKEDLVRQFEICQQEYISMRRNYDEKIKLLHDSLAAANRERDLAMKNVVGPVKERDIHQLTKAKYEEKIKRLGKEIVELKDKLSECTKTIQTKVTSNDLVIKNLKASLEAAKQEKIKLTTRLNDETSKLKTDCFSHDSEIKELRLKERRALEEVKKYKKAFEFQKALLQKRVDQFMQAKAKIRQLLNVMRKKHISLSSPSVGVDLSSPSWQRIQSGSRSPLITSRSVEDFQVENEKEAAGIAVVDGMDLDIDETDKFNEVEGEGKVSDDEEELGGLNDEITACFMETDESNTAAAHSMDISPFLPRAKSSFILSNESPCLDDSQLTNPASPIRKTPSIPFLARLRQLTSRDNLKLQANELEGNNKGSDGEDRPRTTMNDSKGNSESVELGSAGRNKRRDLFSRLFSPKKPNE